MVSPLTLRQFYRFVAITVKKVLIARLLKLSTYYIQAHDISVRTMVWSHNDSWMVTGDHGGYVKYWQSNMNNVKMYQAHKEAIRGIRYCLMIVIVNCIYHFAAVITVAVMRLPRITRA